MACGTSHTYIRKISSSLACARVHLTYLVRIDHEHGPGRPCVLPHQTRLGRRDVPFREILRIINDGADDPPPAQIVVDVRADFHLEVVEPRLHGLFGELGDFCIVVAWRWIVCVLGRCEWDGEGD
jgi:hypothetical protein